MAFQMIGHPLQLTAYAARPVALPAYAQTHITRSRRSQPATMPQQAGYWKPSYDLNHFGSSKAMHDLSYRLGQALPRQGGVRLPNRTSAGAPYDPARQSSVGRLPPMLTPGGRGARIGIAAPHSVPSFEPRPDATPASSGVGFGKELLEIVREMREQLASQQRSIAQLTEEQRHTPAPLSHDSAEIDALKEEVVTSKAEIESLRGRVAALEAALHATATQSASRLEPGSGPRVTASAAEVPCVDETNNARSAKATEQDADFTQSFSVTARHPHPSYHGIFAGTFEAEEEAAATRVCAVYRGSAARKQVAARRTAGDSSDQAAAAPGPGEEDILAATKLEARVRGRAARAEAARRRAAGESKEAVAAAEAEADVADANAEAIAAREPSEEEVMAATRMGALYRGSAARKQVAARRTAGDETAADAQDEDVATDAEDQPPKDIDPPAQEDGGTETKADTTTEGGGGNEEPEADQTAEAEVKAEAETIPDGEVGADAVVAASEAGGADAEAGERDAIEATPGEAAGDVEAIPLDEAQAGGEEAATGEDAEAIPDGEVGADAVAAAAGEAGGADAEAAEGDASDVTPGEAAGDIEATPEAQAGGEEAAVGEDAEASP